jgi:hypothetical protein
LDTVARSGMLRKTWTGESWVGSVSVSRDRDSVGMDNSSAVPHYVGHRGTQRDSPSGVRDVQPCASTSRKAPRVLLLMDAFAQAVDDARRRLSRLEGHEISIRDLGRRAGIPESTMNYTLKDRPGAGGRRRVRLEVVEKLAEALKPVITRAELVRAAQVSAGYQVTEEVEEETDLGRMIVRYLQEPRTRQERLELLAQLNEILASEARRLMDENDSGQ